MSVQITCRQCGAMMTVPPSRAERRRHCSRTCYAAWMAANMTGEKALRFGKGHTIESRQKMADSQRANGRTGVKSATWKGGRYLSRGYVMVKLSALTADEQEMFASMATRNQGEYIPEHRLVVARQVGRPLTAKDHVHHVNGMKSDNRSANLELHTNMSHRMKHAAIEAEMFRLRRENEQLRAALSTYCDVTALPAGGSTST